MREGWRRWLWFVALWCASGAVLGVVALADAPPADDPRPRSANGPNANSRRSR